MQKKEVALNVHCPKCGKSLMDKEHEILDKPSIKLQFDFKGERWIVRLCSIYGAYDTISEIAIGQNDIIDFFCPHCNENLRSKSVCEKCKTPLVILKMDNGGTVNICSRKGCQNHFISFKEITDDIIKFFSQIK